MTQIKICGITDTATFAALARNAVNFAGFVCVPRSGRFVSVERAAQLANHTPANLRRFALFADAADDVMAAYLEKMPVEFLQLHGAETPARVCEIRARYQKPVIKACGISTADDLNHITAYEAVSDWLLIDAKAEVTGHFGGTGRVFDWKLLQERKFSKPWMLAGGLNPENIRLALDVLAPDGVDVSSGVEDVAGRKDDEKIAAFVEKVRHGG